MRQLSGVWYEVKKVNVGIVTISVPFKRNNEIDNPRVWVEIAKKVKIEEKFDSIEIKLAKEDQDGKIRLKPFSTI